MKEDNHNDTALMEIIADYPMTTLLIIVVLALAFLVTSLVLHNRRVSADNKNAAVKIIDDIRSQIGWEGKQRWTDGDTMEFVTVLLGQTPGYHRVWARVKVQKTSLSVVIEYAHFADLGDINWARFLLREFMGRNVPATMRIATGQPTQDEIQVPVHKPVNEFDESPPTSL